MRSSTDLKKTTHMADAQSTHLVVERSRMIHTYRGVEFSSERLDRETIFYKDHADFQPEVVVVDGFDFEKAEETELAALKEYAKKHNVELWLSALTHRDDPVTNANGIPNPVARFEAWVDVMVALEPQDSAVTLRLLKDHDNPNVEDLHLRLDPRTFLLLTE